LQATLSAISLEEIERLKLELQSQTAKAKRFWRMRCEQMLESDELVEAKELEIASLRAQLAAIRTHEEKGALSNVTATEFTNIVVSTPKSRQRETDSCLAFPKLMENSALSSSRKGKAPPMDLFTDQSDVLWEDWLPTFELAAAWNN